MSRKMPRKPSSSAKTGKKKTKRGPARAGKRTGAPAKPAKAKAKARKAPPTAAEKPKKVKAPAKVALPKDSPAAILAAKVRRKAKAAKKAATPKPAPRLKIVWAVCDHTLKTLKTFPYPERRAAEIEAARLQKSKGKEHIVRAERVPMTAPKPS